MKKLLVLPFMLPLLNGCITPPSGLERDKFTIQNLRKIHADDYVCQCKRVRLGGKVITATAQKERTKVEILSLPIATFSAKPVLDSVSDGRFIVYLAGFVDPESLKDQYITIAGTLKGSETGKIDQADYVYPVVDATAYKHWRLVQEYYYAPDAWSEYWYERRFGSGLYLFPPEPRLRYNLY